MSSFSHQRTWAAIDKLAESRGLTLHGLSVKAGVSPPSLSKATRHGKKREHWPSMELIFKITKATDCGPIEFIGFFFGDKK